MYNGPCKGCEERHYLCHSTCEKYLTWKQEHEEIMALIRKEKKLNDDIYHSSRYANGRKRRRPYADHRGGY